MATIPIRDVPGEAVQPSGDELILIDNGIAMQKATINDAVTPKATEIADDKIAALNLGTASQANVEDFATAAQGELADTAVQPERTITAGDGLTGGGDLSADRTISLNSASIASLALADTAVQPSRTINAGDGLTGGGDLSADLTISLDASSIASLALADSAVQPGDLATVATSGDYEDLQNKPTLGTAAAANIGEAASDVAAGNRGLPSGGSTGEVLVKNSGSDYDAEWREVASATAVSYAPQTLDPSEQAQARANIAARRALTGTDYIFPAIGEGEVILEAGTEDEVFREFGNVIFDPDDEAYPWKLTYAAHQGAYAENNVYVYGAKSADGKTWLKTGKLFARAAEDPYLVKRNGTFYLFVEDKEDVPFRNIRLFSATDFEDTWTDEGDVLDIGTGWESVDVSSPVVWEEGGTWYMLYEGRATGQSGAIGLATAPNPAGPWTKDAGNPIITGWQTAPGPLGWASHLVPDDIRKVDGKYYLLVHGVLQQNTFDTTYVIAFVPGLLVSSDLKNWHDPLGSPISVPVAAGSTNDRTVSGELQFFELDGELFVLGHGSEAGLGVYRPLTAVRNIFKAGSPQVQHPMEANTWVEFPDLTVVTLDSLNGFDADTNEWVCKRSGFYRFTAMFNAVPAEPNTLMAVAVRINGATEYVLGQDMCGEYPPGSPAGVTADGADTLYLRVGDKVKFYGYIRTGIQPTNNLARVSVTVELVG